MTLWMKTRGIRKIEALEAMLALSLKAMLTSSLEAMMAFGTSVEGCTLIVTRFWYFVVVVEVV